MFEQFCGQQRASRCMACYCTPPLYQQSATLEPCVLWPAMLSTSRTERKALARPRLSCSCCSVCCVWPSRFGLQVLVSLGQTEQHAPALLGSEAQRWGAFQLWLHLQTVPVIIKLESSKLSGALASQCWLAAVKATAAQWPHGHCSRWCCDDSMHWACAGKLALHHHHKHLHHVVA